MTKIVLTAFNIESFTSHTLSSHATITASFANGRLFGVSTILTHTKKNYEVCYAESKTLDNML